MVRTSFLIPVRNAEATLEAALHSVLAQTDPDFEVVVVDDGSVDRSLEIAMSTGDSRVRCIRGTARGIAPALNRGLSECRGRWIARMDGDDLAAPDRLARQLPELEADPRLGLIDGQVRFFRDTGEVPPGMLRYQDWVNRVIEPADFDRLLLVESPVVHPAATLSRDAVLAAGGYRDGDFPEDYDLWLRLHSAGWRLRKIPEVLVHMRDRPKRLTRTDPRYRRAAFRKVQQNWLAAGPLSEPRRVVLIGAGKRSRPWLRWLLDRGVEVTALVDVRGPGPDRSGVPVVGPDGLGSVGADLALLAIGTDRAGARAWMSQVRPEWSEGNHWWLV